MGGSHITSVLTDIKENGQITLHRKEGKKTDLFEMEERDKP